MPTQKTLIITMALALAGCWNLTGHNHEAAVDNAIAYAKKLEASGVEARVVECNDHDTDGDGYLSCTIAIAGTPTQVECAGYGVVDALRNKGCRAPKINLRTMPRRTSMGD